MDKTSRSIDILVFSQMNLLDMAGPLQVFYQASYFGGTHYDLRTVSMDGASVRSSCGVSLNADGPAGVTRDADDLLVPGGPGVDAMMGRPEVDALIGKWLETRPHGRLISVCSGALLLAGAGALEGKSATTHWERAERAAQQFPDVRWRLDELFCRDGSTYSSAGVTAGIDLCLAIVRQDAGAETALSVARELVVYLHRHSGQSQFSELLESQFKTSTALQGLISELLQNPSANWTLQSMADRVAMTPRTLSRRFAQELNDSPVHFVEKVRVKFACNAISSGMPQSRVIELSGFGDFQRMQRAFKRNLNSTVGDFQKGFAPVHQSGFGSN
ncbi:MAG: DJ-1/PfpI family protein [Pseudomonadota bacterium]